MEMGLIFYELDPLFIYEDSTFGSYYVLGIKPRVRLYVLRDRPFAHPINSLDFDPDQLYDFSLS
ncbi:hypothetical protein AHAS_Ahas05G0064800 [Arachis hypogaea]